MRLQHCLRIIRITDRRDPPVIVLASTPCQNMGLPAMMPSLPARISRPSRL